MADSLLEKAQKIQKYTNGEITLKPGLVTEWGVEIFAAFRENPNDPETRQSAAIVAAALAPTMAKVGSTLQKVIKNTDLSGS